MSQVLLLLRRWKPRDTELVRESQWRFMKRVKAKEKDGFRGWES